MASAALFASIVFLSAVFSTVVGFGTLTIVLPIISLFIDVRAAIGILTVVAMFLVIAKAWAFRKDIDYGCAVRVGVPALVGAAVGAYMLGVADASVVKKFLGVMVLAYVVMSVTGLSERIRVRGAAVYVISLIYGLVTGFVGVGEMISAPLLLSLGLRRGRFVGTFSLISLFTLPVKMVIYWHSGILNGSQMPVIAVLSVAAIFGVIAGKKLMLYVKPKVFEDMALVTLAVMSLILLFGA